jgi:copper(I)-binding protein
MRPDAKRLVAVALVLAVVACGSHSGVLSADRGWVRAMPPGAGGTAAYLTLHNGTPESVRIERITAAGFAAVAVHETTMDDGVMRMRPAPPLELAPDQSVTLAPGGMHLMLTGADATVADGDRVEITFWRDGAGALTVDLPVSGDNPYASP